VRRVQRINWKKMSKRCEQATLAPTINLAAE
jgi:hypothetical protein